MFKRIVSAVVGIAIAVVILFFADTPVLPAAVALLIIGALYELLNVCGCMEFKTHTAGCFAYGAVMPFLCAYTPDIRWRLLLSGFVMILMFMGYVGDHKKLPFSKLCEMITCTILVSFSLSGLVTLYYIDKTHGVTYIVISLASAWLADAGAYFVGTFCGKHKLCPDISPKKTVEGAVGGVFTNMIFLCIYCLCYQKFQASRDIIFDVNYISVAVIGFVASIMGMFGDLTASLLKREHNVKDYGKIMPGHGGVMDRFDSVLFVLPFSVVYLIFFNIFS